MHAADLQDRDGALLVLDRQTRRLFPFLETIFADGAYGGQKLRRAMDHAAWRIEVVKRSANALVKHHGQDAPIEAAMRAVAMLEVAIWTPTRRGSGYCGR